MGPDPVGNAPTGGAGNAATGSAGSAPRDLVSEPGVDDGTEAVPPAVSAWTVAVYLVGDNDLEAYVMNDLDELERAGAGPDVRIVVQADRSPGYVTGDGDWTGTRRYEIIPDGVDGVVKSPVVADMGELDMGDPATLADFLAWVDDNYPAERTALVMWDHGSGWDMAAQSMIGSDDTSGSALSVARGDLALGLEARTAAHGPLDVIAFDACNMASWEVAHVLRPHALAMAASAATVGWEGLQYDLALAALSAAPDTDGLGLADLLARSAAGVGFEPTFSAVDLAMMDDLSVAIDAVALPALTDPVYDARLRRAASTTMGMDAAYSDWWLDLGDLATQLQADPDPAVSASGEALEDAVAAAVISSYSNGPMSGASGLTIFGDPWYNRGYNRLYAYGAGATWAPATHWDEVLARWAGH
jgi:hypothetical protein